MDLDLEGLVSRDRRKEGRTGTANICPGQRKEDRGHPLKNAVCKSERRQVSSQHIQGDPSNVLLTLSICRKFFNPEYLSRVCQLYCQFCHLRFDFSYKVYKDCKVFSTKGEKPFSKIQGISLKNDNCPIYTKIYTLTLELMCIFQYILFHNSH